MLFNCHYKDDNEYPTFEDMAKHLNKTTHKVSFLAIRSNTGSTTFHPQAINTEDTQHSFGVPRYFFRFNLTCAINNQPYSHVHWAMFKLRKCHRASFEGTMTRDEWMTGPTARQGISPFCYVEDCIPSRFALGFDVNSLHCHFIGLDPERVGLENIEVPQLCDFGDNILDYMTRGGHLSDDDVDVDVDDVVDDDDDDDDDDDVCTVSSSSSEESAAAEEVTNYGAALPAKFITFLKS